MPSNENAGPLQLMYGIDGRSDLTEQTLDHLEGYRGSSPGANRQWSPSAIAIGHLRRADGRRLSAQQVRRADRLRQLGTLRRLVDWLCDNWQRPDDGIWEVRGGSQHFVYSKFMSWVALDRSLRLADKRSFPADRARWLKVRDEIYEEVMSAAGTPSARRSCRPTIPTRWTLRSADAAGVLHGSQRSAYAEHGRRNSPLGCRRAAWLPTVWSIATIPARPSTIWRSGGHVQHVLVLARRGADPRRPHRSAGLEDARLLFEQMLGYANHLGLYSEQTGASGEALGNFPQAFTHLALISAAFNLDRALDGKPRS